MNIFKSINDIFIIMGLMQFTKKTEAQNFKLSKPLNNRLPVRKTYFEDNTTLFYQRIQILAIFRKTVSIDCN